MPITALPNPPSRTDIANFAARADALLTALPTFVTQANALEASLQAITTQGTITTSLTIATGAQTLTTQTAKGWIAGSYVWVVNSAAPANYMIGSVTSYNSATGVLVLNVTTIGGTGTAAAWNIALAPPPAAGTNLAGGAAGVMPYQSAAGVTGFTAAGTAGQVLQSNGAAAPTWTSALSVTTQLPSVNSTAAASTAFVRSIGSGRSQIITVSTVTQLDLTISHVGALVDIIVNSPNIRLPLASTVPAGLGYEFQVIGTSIGASYVNVSGTDKVTSFGVISNALVLVNRSNVFLISDGVSNWKVSASSKPNATGVWQSGLPTVVNTLGHGLGYVPNLVQVLAECTATDGTYSVGDRVCGLLNLSGTTPIPAHLFANATAVGIAPASSTWQAVPKTGGALVTLTNANWRWALRAE